MTLSNMNSAPAELTSEWLTLTDGGQGSKRLQAAAVEGRGSAPFHFSDAPDGKSGAFTSLDTRFSLLSDGKGISWSVMNPPEGGAITFRFCHYSTRLEFAAGSLQVAIGAAGEYSFDEAPASISALDNEQGAISILPMTVSHARCRVRTFANGNPTEVDLYLSPADGGESSRANEFAVYTNSLPYPLEKASDWRMDDPIDLRVTLGGIYAGAAASLGGAEVAGSAYPTMRAPVRAYGDLHTFFDIDAYFTVATLCLSGDQRLETEGRRILERAASQQNAAGQIPHHFDGEEATWLAISGASQLGPNLFWLLAVHDYVCSTGDEEFLRERYPAVRKAAEWLEARFDPARKLIHTDGPLWIDVFRKDGFSYDSNAMAIWALSRIAPLCGHCGDAEAESRFLSLVEKLREGIETLWDTDHFITSVSSDGVRRDMWDADNYGAVAFDLIADPDRAERVLRFMDAIPDMHPGGKATWVSGKYYDEGQCYLENTGDSACAMARLFWIDLKARHRVRDAAAFRRYFDAVRQDFLDHTWMRERYNAAGEMFRAEGYVEYPEILALSLRESWYGIELGFSEVFVRPLKPGKWTYANRRLQIRHDPEDFLISVPGTGSRKFLIEGLAPRTDYQHNGQESVCTDQEGVLIFTGQAGEPHQLRPASAL